MKIFKVHIIST